MNTSTLLQQAIDAARSGKEQAARDMFLEIVRIEPGNEVAWMWLTGLLDELEDRIIACERVLSINPKNQKTRKYFDRLLEEQKARDRKNLFEVEERVLKAHELIKKRRRPEALLLLQNIVNEEKGSKQAWLLYADLAPDISDKVRAYETIFRIEPHSEEIRQTLERYRYYQRNPMELAASYEEDGKLDEALDLYRFLAKDASDPSEFDRIYKNITRLEDVEVENIQHIQPSLTIIRLSAGLPILYLLEIFLQEGLNPVKNPAFALWLGIPPVILGSFLVTVAGVSLRHAIWKKWFGAPGSKGSMAARVLVSALGLMLVLGPHLLLIWDSVLRLQNFQIPAIPWSN